MEPVNDGYILGHGSENPPVKFTDEQIRFLKHHINNPLAIIRLNVEVENRKDGQSKERDAVAAQVDRIAKLLEGI